MGHQFRLNETQVHLTVCCFWLDGNLYVKSYVRIPNERIAGIWHRWLAKIRN